MQDSKQGARAKWWIAVLGSGLALSPIHNTVLTNLATNSKGEVVFFLPAFAFVLIIVGSGFFLLNNWERVKERGWGDKRVTIPLFIIIGAMALSGIVIPGFSNKVAPLGMGTSLFALYLTARVLGKDLFFPLGIGAVAASLGVLAYNATHPWKATGGYVFEANFDILAGYVLMGAALFFTRYRWLMAGLAVVALFLSGSPEALLPLGVVGLAVIVRKDWSRRLLFVIVPLVLIVILVLTIGPGDTLYNYVYRVITNDTTMVAGTLPDGSEARGSPLTWRLDLIRMMFDDLRLLGNGYNATAFTITTVHNVPLILIQQMGYPGILAALAWLWICIWCLVKTRWKYVWLLVLALSVFDHYIWDQLGPIWWAVVGASSTATNTDLIFKSDPSSAPQGAPAPWNPGSLFEGDRQRSFQPGELGRE